MRTALLGLPIALLGAIALSDATALAAAPVVTKATPDNGGTDAVKGMEALQTQVDAEEMEAEAFEELSESSPGSRSLAEKYGEG